MAPKRRSLVLVDETARHPFRQSLPPHVRLPVPDRRGALDWLNTNAADWRGFLAAYCATFVAVTVFIS